MEPQINQPNGTEKVVTNAELVELIKNSFQSAQEHVDQKFAKVDERFDKVENRLGKVERKLDDLVDTYDKEKLPMRVEYIENVLNLHKK